MYKNAGRKIMILAELLGKLGMIILGIISALSFKTNPIFAIVLAVAGCLGVWVSSLCLFGFGNLISETAANRETNDRILDILESRYGHQYNPDFAAYQSACAAEDEEPDLN